MRIEFPRPVYFKDYVFSAWRVDRVDLHVAIHEGYRGVRAVLEQIAARPALMKGVGEVPADLLH